MRLRRCPTSGGVVLWDEGSKTWVNLADAQKQFGTAETLASDCQDTIRFLGLSSSTKVAWASAAAAAASAGKASSSTPPDANIPLEAMSFRDGALFSRHMDQARKGFMPLALANGHFLQLFFGQLVGKTIRLPNLVSTPRKPPYYVGNPLTFVPNGAEARWPSHAAWLDYELEVALVLGAPVSAMPTIAEVEAAIARSAFVLINDFSARDTQADELASVGFGFVKCKSFCTSVASELVTADELWQAGDKGLLFETGLQTTVTVNGEVWGRGSTSDSRVCSLAEYVAFAALDEGLHAGEVLGLGTVPDCCGLEVGRWLKPGDTITLACNCLGQLTNTVGAPPPDAVNYRHIGEDESTRISRLKTAAKLIAMAVVVPPLSCILFLGGALSALVWKGPPASPGLSSISKAKDD